MRMTHTIIKRQNGHIYKGRYVCASGLLMKKRGPFLMDVYMSVCCMRIHSLYIISSSPSI